MMMVIIMVVVVSIVPYLTDKGEHTPLYKIKKNVNIKQHTYISIILFPQQNTHTHTHTHTQTHGCEK